MVSTTALRPVERMQASWLLCVQLATSSCSSLTWLAGWLGVMCRSFDMGAQVWNARSIANGAIVSTLRDGFKYLVGVKWLPTGWEVG
jgi:hypothetical protein